MTNDSGGKMKTNNLARALGWSSIGIGMAEIAAPKQLEQFMGISDGENSGILRMLGVREILQGVDILAHRDPTPGVWARVAGDALDSALLIRAATKTRNPGGMAAISAMVLGIGILDVLCATGLSTRRRAE
jgi:hypothetical protein